MKLREDCVDPVLVAFVQIATFGARGGLGQITCPAHLVDKPITSFAHRKMQTHLKGLPRAEILVEPVLCTFGDFTAGQHLRCPLRLLDTGRTSQPGLRYKIR